MDQSDASPGELRARLGVLLASVSLNKAVNAFVNLKSGLKKESKELRVSFLTEDFLQGDQQACQAEAQC